MFDIGFWELTLLAVIALIVLGPERLPVVARTAGQWVGRAKGYVRGLTSELEREVNADEIRQQIKRTREQIEADTHDAIGDNESKAERDQGRTHRAPGHANTSHDRPDGSVERAGGTSRSAEEVGRDHARQTQETQDERE